MDNVIMLLNACEINSNRFMTDIEISLTLFGPASSVVCQARGGSDTWMKLCVNQYSYESMPTEKFQFGIFSSFGDITSQNITLKGEASHKIGIITPEKWI